METLKTEGNRDLGNTISKSRITPCKKWCFTLNNYTIEEVETLETEFKKKNIFYIFGKEIGESGTPHLQGYIEANIKIRPTECFTCKRAHWEKTKGTKDQNIAYCSKENNISTNMPLKRPDLYILNLTIENFYKWQKEVLTIIDETPDRRTIHWYYETKGNTGKSTFAKWVYMHRNDVRLITCTKSSDITTCANDTIKTYIIDIPRSVESQYFYPWTAIEQLKNGFVTDGKLKKHVEVTCCSPPHIIIFSNFIPALTMMSTDRWRIRKIDESDF